MNKLSERLSRLRGFRLRLLLTLALLGVLSAALAAGAGYQVARNEILQSAQDREVNRLLTQIKHSDAIRKLPADQRKLNELAEQLSGPTYNVLVCENRKTCSNYGPDPALFTAELRRTVAGGDVTWQRVTNHGTPTLAMGTRLETRSPGGSATTSGIVVYATATLTDEAASIARLRDRAWLTGGIALAFAVLLTFPASRSVLRPLRALGNATRRLGTGDLTARAEVRGHDDLAQVAETFNTTAESLQSHVEQLRRMQAEASRFVADVSHELRNPLATMTAVTDLLDAEAGRLGGDAGRAAALVSAETHQLVRLVDDLIEISRFDDNRIALAPEELDLVESVRATLAHRSWTEHVQLTAPEQLHAYADPRRLEVILANLVANAFRHGAEPVFVRCAETPDWITVEVGDHGPGLEPEVAAQVFDRFYKADTARSRSAGSGLGLAIALANARAHGGELFAGNRPGGGAVFTLRLPRKGAR